MKTSIPVEEARTTILSRIEVLGAERVGVAEALGRVLAENLSSPWDLPPLDNAAMDGFAVRAVDLAQASKESPIALPLAESLRAGQLPSGALKAGSVARIMTGAPIPPGADTVVKVEDTRSEGGSVIFSKAPPLGEHLRKAGEDVRQGEEVLNAGTLMHPGCVAMAASLGRATVKVHQRPRVAVLCTGDELVEVGEDRSGGRFVASNLYSLEAQIRQCGALPVVLGIVPDDVEQIEAVFRQAAACDVIVSTGGVSVGDFDFVKEVLGRIGTRMVFWRVAMKPGHPLAFGLIENRPVFGLPGNPVSTMVSFEQFVRPALLKMMGHQNLLRPVLRARLKERIKQRPGRTVFLRGILKREPNGELSVQSTGAQGSGMLRSMVLANGLIVMPAEASVLEEGELVDVQVIDPAFLLAEGR